MNLNKYTEKAQEAVIGSQQLAEQSGHPLIEPEHLLITLAGVTLFALVSALTRITLRHWHESELRPEP